jgi:hypothetical protein
MCAVVPSMIKGVSHGGPVCPVLVCLIPVLCFCSRMVLMVYLWLNTCSMSGTSPDWHCNVIGKSCELVQRAMHKVKIYILRGPQPFGSL